MTRARDTRSWFWLLLAAALLTRAFVPQGYMPERSERGVIAVKLCTSDGVWLVPIDRKDGDPRHEGKRADQPCAFAGLAPATVPPSGLPAPVPPAPAAISYVRAQSPPAPLAAPHLRPPARAPPLAA